MRKLRIRNIFTGVLAGLGMVIGAAGPVMAAEAEELAKAPEAKYVEASQPETKESEGLLSLRPRVAIETGYNIQGYRSKRESQNRKKYN